MLEIIQNYGLFFAKTATVVIAVIVILAFLVSLFSRGKSEKKEQLEIRNLNKKYDNYRAALEEELLDKKANKKLKKEKKKEKKGKKSTKVDIKNRVFVLDFAGDIKASGVDSIREEITALLTIAEEKDEVLVKLESGGGYVHSYGLAASQLLRIKNRNIKLTISVDKIAASGGYLMACIGDKILASPFAVIGSIGVIAQMPNFNRFLKENKIDFEQITAGKYKRTLTLFGENKDEDREKLQQELEETHDLFKDFIRQNRAQVDIDRVATGEHWFGTRALELNLIDEIATSDDYLSSSSQTKDIFELKIKVKKSWLEKLPFFS